MEEDIDRAEEGWVVRDRLVQVVEEDDGGEPYLELKEPEELIRDLKVSKDFVPNEANQVSKVEVD